MTKVIDKTMMEVWFQKESGQTYSKPYKRLTEDERHAVSLDLLQGDEYLRLNKPGETRYLSQKRSESNAFKQLEFIAANNLSMVSMEEILRNRIERSDTIPDWCDYQLISNDVIASYMDNGKGVAKLCRNFDPRTLYEAVDHSRNHVGTISFGSPHRFETGKEIIDIFEGEILSEEEVTRQCPEMINKPDSFWIKLVTPETFNEYAEFTQKRKKNFRGYPGHLVYHQNWQEGISIGRFSMGEQNEWWPKYGTVTLKPLAIDPHPKTILWPYGEWSSTTAVIPTKVPDQHS